MINIHVDVAEDDVTPTRKCYSVLAMCKYLWPYELDKPRVEVRSRWLRPRREGLFRRFYSPYEIYSFHVFQTLLWFSGRYYEELALNRSRIDPSSRWDK